MTSSLIWLGRRPSVEQKSVGEEKGSTFSPIIMTWAFLLALPTLGLQAPFSHNVAAAAGITVSVGVAVPAVARRSRGVLLQAESTEKLLELWAEGQAVAEYTRVEARKAKQEAQRVERLGLRHEDFTLYSAVQKSAQEKEAELALVLNHIVRLETQIAEMKESERHVVELKDEAHMAVQVKDAEEEMAAAQAQVGALDSLAPSAAFAAAPRSDRESRTQAVRMAQPKLVALAEAPTPYSGYYRHRLRPDT